MTAPTPAPAQRVCGLCSMELAPGTQPATTGIYPACVVRVEQDAKGNTD
jgi:hypothetical protein